MRFACILAAGTTKILAADLELVFSMVPVAPQPRPRGPLANRSGPRSVLREVSLG